MRCHHQLGTIRNDSAKSIPSPSFRSPQALRGTTRIGFRFEATIITIHFHMPATSNERPSRAARSRSQSRFPGRTKPRTCEIIDEGLLAILCVAPLDVLPSGLSAGRNRQRHSLKYCEARAEGTRIGFAAPLHQKSATEIGSWSPARGISFQTATDTTCCCA